MNQSAAVARGSVTPLTPLTLVPPSTERETDLYLTVRFTNLFGGQAQVAGPFQTEGQRESFKAGLTKMVMNLNADFGRSKVYPDFENIASVSKPDFLHGGSLNFWRELIKNDHQSLYPDPSFEFTRDS